MTEIANAPATVRSVPRTASLRLSYHSVALVARGLDIISISISSLFGVLLYRYSSHSGLQAVDISLGIAAVGGLSFNISANHLNLYSLPALLQPERSFQGILLSIAVMSVFLTFVLYLLHLGSDVPRVAVTYTTLLTVLTLVPARVLLARVLNQLLAQGALAGRKAILIGEQAELEGLTPSKLLLSFGFKEVSRVLVPTAGESVAAEARERATHAIRMAREHNAEEVVVAIAWNRVGLLEQINAALRASPLPVRLLPDNAVSTMMGDQVATANGSIAAIELQRAPLTLTERRVKRALDILVATAALVPLSPIMALAALAIRLDSPGPILFRQQRTGFDGERFRIHKFRTMTVLEDGDRIVQAKADDRRVTRVGAFLRRTSIDELPQLFNVLAGDMSLVGPRPHALAHDQQYQQLISSYPFRFHVRPGITGWAQVNGLRGETARLEEMEKRVEFDLWYINNWSFGLDFWILLRTVFEIVRHKAY